MLPDIKYVIKMILSLVVSGVLKEVGVGCLALGSLLVAPHSSAQRLADLRTQSG